MLVCVSGYDDGTLRARGGTTCFRRKLDASRLGFDIVIHRYLHGFRCWKGVRVLDSRISKTLRSGSPAFVA